MAELTDEQAGEINGGFSPARIIVSPVPIPHAPAKPTHTFPNKNL